MLYFSEKGALLKRNTQVDLFLTDEGTEYLGEKFGNICLREENESVQIIPVVEGEIKNEEMYFLTTGYHICITVKKRGDENKSLADDTKGYNSESKISSEEATHDLEASIEHNTNMDNYSNVPKKKISDKDESSIRSTLSENKNEKQSESITPKSYGILSMVSTAKSQINNKSTNYVVAKANKPSPKTGDKFHSLMWLTIAGASAGVAATAIIAKRKKKI